VEAAADSGTESLDFRGVQAFDAKQAYVMSSGEGAQSRIYKTTDGGEHWKLQYQGGQKEFFLDALTCEVETRCTALSDPVNGKFVVLANTDGEHWVEMAREKMPAALPKEGRSRRAIRRFAGGNDIHFGTGGPAARVFASQDFGKTWAVVETPIVSGMRHPEFFHFSATRGRLSRSAEITRIRREPIKMPRYPEMEARRGNWPRTAGGYRSAVGKYAGGFVAVGRRNGTSADGLRWNSIGKVNLNAFGSSF